MSCSCPNGMSSSMPLTAPAPSPARRRAPGPPPSALRGRCRLRLTSTSRPGGPPRTSVRDRFSRPGAGTMRLRHSAMNSLLRVSRPSGSTSCTRRLANWSPREPCRRPARSCCPSRATAMSTSSSPKCASVSFRVLLQVADEPLHPLRRGPGREAHAGEQDLPFGGGKEIEGEPIAPDQADREQQGGHRAAHRWSRAGVPRPVTRRRNAPSRNRSNPWSNRRRNAPGRAPSPRRKVWCR